MVTRLWFGNLGAVCRRFPHLWNVILSYHLLDVLHQQDYETSVPARSARPTALARQSFSCIVGCRAGDDKATRRSARPTALARQCLRAAHGSLV